MKVLHKGKAGTAFPSAAILAAIVFFTSCTGNGQYPQFGFLGSDYTRDLAAIFNEDDFSSRFVLMEGLSRKILEEKGTDAFRSFVHQYSLINPDDPYDSYYLLYLAEALEESEAVLSRYYYNLLLDEYEDVVVNGRSTHFYALNGLLALVNEPSLRIRYYNQLLERYPDYIDEGRMWYWLAQEYRSDGQYSEYFRSLEEFQKFPQTIIPGINDIHARVAEELQFHNNSRKDWTSPSLTTLVTNIKNALYYKDTRSLERYRAKENFFAMSWLQNTDDFNSRPNFDLGRFLLNARRIYFASDFTIVNEQEAYLHTWAWSTRINDWYFYFKKIDYPADPEIHGNWEWAGIYFGDTL